MAIRGITIELVTRTQTDADPFGRPIYTETVEYVDNVLVGEPKHEEVIETLNLTGRKVKYTLAIPKGDTHVWENQFVILPFPFSGRYQVVGIPTAGIEENIPLSWNTKVQVARCG